MQSRFADGVNRRPRSGKNAHGEKSCKFSQMPKVGEDYVNVDDEGDDGYVRGGYHPCKIGDRYGRAREYEVVEKLGWGHFSTVFLAYNHMASLFVALKVQKSDSNYTQAALEEIHLLETMSSHNVPHAVRLLDTFEIHGPNGRHVVMVLPVYGVNLLSAYGWFGRRGMPLDLVRAVAVQLLAALDGIHRSCGIIHTDIKPENVLLVSPPLPVLQAMRSFQEHLACASKATGSHRPAHDRQQGMLGSKEDGGADDSNGDKNNGNEDNDDDCNELQGDGAVSQFILAADGDNNNNNDDGDSPEDAADDSRMPGASAFTDLQLRRKEQKKKKKNARKKQMRCDGADRSAAASSALRIRNSVSSSLDADAERERLLAGISVVLTDFGNSCFLEQAGIGEIQTRQYRSPEVILGQRHGTPSDMWSLACLLFELATGDYLFDPKQSSSFTREEDHLAQMLELLGRMPLSVACTGDHAARFFTRKGELRSIKRLDLWPLKDVLVEKYRFGPQTAGAFSSFLLSMLQYAPSKRGTAQECLQHPFLTLDLAALEALDALAASGASSRGPAAATALDNDNDDMESVEEEASAVLYDEAEEEWGEEEEAGEEQEEEEEEVVVVVEADDVDGEEGGHIPGRGVRRYRGTAAAHERVVYDAGDRPAQMLRGLRPPVRERQQAPGRHPPQQQQHKVLQAESSRSGIPAHRANSGNQPQKRLVSALLHELDGVKQQLSHAVAEWDNLRKVAQDDILTLEEFLVEWGLRCFDS